MTRITETMCLAQLTETDADLLAGNSKKLYTPTNEDISTRHLRVYWKQCRKCREYLKIKTKLYMEKKQKLIKYI